MAYAERYITDLGRQWTDLPPHLYPRFQKLVFPEGIRYTKGVGFGTAKLGLIFELNETIGVQKSDLVDYLLLNWNYLTRELQEWQSLGMDIEKYS